MRSPWKLLAALEALALVAVFLLWPRGSDSVAVDRNEQSPRQSQTRSPDRPGETEAGASRLAEEDVSRETLGEEQEDVTQDDPLGIVVYGHVQDERGEPVPGFSVRFDNRSDPPTGDLTDDSGNYAIFGLQPDTYELTGRKRGFLTDSEAFEVAPGTQRKDLVVRRAQAYMVRLETRTGEELLAWLADHVEGLSRYRRAVSVVVTPEPLTAAAPVRSGPPRSPHGTMFARNTAGGHDLPAGVTGRLLLSSPLPMFATAMFQHEVLASVTLPPDVDSITIPVDERRILGTIGSVRMRVVDAESGQPVEGARVSVSDGSFGGTGPVTGEDGRAAREGLPPGILRLEVYHKDYAMLWQSFLLESGMDRDLGDVRLAPNATLAVTAVLPDGSPAAAAPFAFAIPAPEWSLGLDRTQSFSLDGDGEVELKRMPAGPVRVIAMDTDATARQVVPVYLSPGRTTRVEMRLESGTEVEVRAEADRYSGYRLDLLDANGEGFGPQLPLGTARLRLTAGRYRIEASTPAQGVCASREFTVGSEPVKVELDLP